MSLSTKNNNYLRNRNKNISLKNSNLTSKNYINFKDVSKSKLFIKYKSLEEDYNNPILFENKGNNVNLIENNEDNNYDNISTNKKYSLVELITIYNSIINKLDILMNSYNKNSFKYIYSCLIKINDNASKIIGENNIINFNLNNNNNSNSNNNNNNDISLIKKYKHKSKINDFKKNYSFISRNKNILNNVNSIDKYKGTKDSNVSIQKNNDLNESNLIRENQDHMRKIKYLQQKISNIENKFKIEEFNYLFCIGEQHKKILELEKEINLNNVDKMSKEELRKYRCFPNYIKFDVIDGYNQKQGNLQKKILRNKCHSSFEKRSNLPMKFFNEQNNNNDDNNHNTELNKNNILQKGKEREKEENKNDDKNNPSNIIKKAKEEQNNLDEMFQRIKEIIEYGKKNFNKDDLFVNKFFDKKKNYFISHPKINYVKYGSEGLRMKTWKINDILETLPKKLSKYKFSSKSQKNSIIVFPSSLNETVVNLEKLRVNKNFRSIEINFEERRKVNKMKNSYNES